MYHFEKMYRPILLDYFTYTGEGLRAIQRFDLEVNFDESLWIEIKQKDEAILLCNVYRPQNTPVSCLAWS